MRRGTFSSRCVCCSDGYWVSVLSRIPHAAGLGRPAAVLLLAIATLGAAELPETIAGAALSKIQAGDFAGAVALLRPQVTRFPGRVDLWNMLGICETELNHPR